jgi:serine phosphatase RsbU (regulator of sigma subunit)
VTESVDPQGTPFGEERLRNLLARQRTASLGDCGRALEAELRAWRGGRPLDDDMTWCALEVL